MRRRCLARDGSEPPAVHMFNRAFLALVWLAIFDLPLEYNRLLAMTFFVTVPGRIGCSNVDQRV